MGNRGGTGNAKIASSWTLRQKVRRRQTSCASFMKDRSDRPVDPSKRREAPVNKAASHFKRPDLPKRSLLDTSRASSAPSEGRRGNTQTPTAEVMNNRALALSTDFAMKQMAG